MGRPAKLTPKQVETIREELDRTNLKTLAKKYSVSIGTIRNAAMGQSPYDNLDTIALDTIPTQRRHRNKLTPEFIQTVKQARQRLEDNPAQLASLIEQLDLPHNSGSNRVIATQYNISIPYVSRICNGHYDE